MTAQSSADVPVSDVWCPTPLTALELDEMPTELHFVRDHFGPPALAPASWSVEVSGARGSIVLGHDGLRRLPRRTLGVVLECAGHRRIDYTPLPAGIPWGAGAVGEARWGGPSLVSVLELVGVPAGATEVVLEGSDAGPVEGFEGSHRFARSLPLSKALDPDVLLADECGCKPIPHDRGGPVRAIVPGWYATDSVKWIDRIYFTREEFGGVFQAHDYRVQLPGEPGPGRRLSVLPVQSLITTPADGGLVTGDQTAIRGVAWGGSRGIAAVLVQLDGGTWEPARRGAFRGRHARVAWELRCALGPGAHAGRSRAVDGAGHAQPDVPPPNVRGYGNNAVHSVRFTAAG